MGQNLKSSVFFFLVLLTLSCSDDDGVAEVEVNRDDFSQEALEGTWDMTSFSSQNAMVTGDFGLMKDVASDVDLEATSIDYQLTFDDASTITPNGSFDLVTTASIITQSITETVRIDSQNTSFIDGDYNVDEDGFTVKNEVAGDMKMTVTSFSEDEMTLSMDLSDTNVLSNFGESMGISNVRLTGTATAVFVRVQ